MAYFTFSTTSISMGSRLGTSSRPGGWSSCRLEIPHHLPGYLMLHLLETTPLRVSVLEGNVAAFRRAASDVAGAIQPETQDMPVVAVLAAPRIGDQFRVHRPSGAAP